jgi:hypothetical protein
MTDPVPPCAGCGAPSSVVWTREATARELASWAGDPLVVSVTEADLDPAAAPTLVPVHACAACALVPELAALVHSPTCHAPPRDAACRACSADPRALRALPEPSPAPDDLFR